MIKKISLVLLLLISNRPFLAAQSKGDIQYDLLIGSGGKEGGIYVYTFNTATGECNYKSEFKGKKAQNPTYLAVSKSGKYLYSVCKGEKGNDGISAFDIDPVSGDLNFINNVPCGGEGPAYVSVDDNRKFVFVGNFGSGSLSAIPINPNGSLNPDIQVIQHFGNSVNKTRQDRPHVHCTILSPDNRYLYATDLGTDKVNVYQFDSTKKSHPLTEDTPPYVLLKPGSGPRHLIFHPNGKFAYLIQEMGGLITAFDFKKDKLAAKQTVSMVSRDFQGEIRAADIHISSDGKFLYGSNRGNANDIVIYSINKKGKLTYRGRQSTLGKAPRNFIIDPTDNYLLAANQATNDIVIFKRNKQTGLLTPLKQRIEVSAPACLKFVAFNNANNRSKVRIKANNISLSVDPNVGARVTSFAIDGKELLSLKIGEEKNYGSTFLLSPQGKWSQRTVNSSVYKVLRSDSSSLHLESELDSITGFQFSKFFFANAKDTSVVIKYTITNASDKEEQVAPWEITRVPVGGLAFFPKGTQPALSKSNLAIKDSNGIIWYPYDSSAIYSRQKLFMNGSEGWLAHIQDSFLIIKKFQHIDPKRVAPGEEDVEIFSNKDKPFIELENQGEYMLLHPGESLTYKVTWYARHLPDSLKAEIGNEALVGLVRRIIDLH